MTASGAAPGRFTMIALFGALHSLLGTLDGDGGDDGQAQQLALTAFRDEYAAAGPPERAELHEALRKMRAVADEYR